jgi:hypothetical protein
LLGKWGEDTDSEEDSLFEWWGVCCR